MNTFRMYFVLALLLVSSGCAARRSDGTINADASLTQTVLTIEASYEAILTGLGDAYRAGEISRPVLERGRRLGKKAEAAIDTAKVVTAAYLRGGGSRVPVFSALSSLTAIMMELEAVYLDVTGRLEGLPRKPQLQS